MKEKISTPARGAIAGGLVVFAGVAIVFLFQRYPISADSLSWKFLLAMMCAATAGILLAWSWLTPEQQPESERRNVTDRDTLEGSEGGGTNTGNTERTDGV